jgi:hypothetical protein
MNFLHLPAFIISLAFGLFLTYITNPNKRTVFVYPTPENVDELLYRDHTDKCFSFEATEVDCPTNPKEIESYTVQ